MKRAALYMRVSTVDQHPETQLVDLRQMAAQRNNQIVRKYTDRLSGAKTKRPGLDQMMTDARRGGLRIGLILARSLGGFSKTAGTPVCRRVWILSPVAPIGEHHLLGRQQGAELPSPSLASNPHLTVLRANYSSMCPMK